MKHSTSMSKSPEKIEAEMQALLYDFRRYFEQRKEEGIDYLESAPPGNSVVLESVSPPSVVTRTKPIPPAAVAPRPPAYSGPASPEAPAPPRKETRDPRELYRQLLAEVQGCRKCPLAATRQKAVLGEGGNRQRMLFIGEGPGKEEDFSGRPFVGRSGQLFDKILASVSLTREDIYITNIIKCRPPGNRDPESAEVVACWPYLETQIELLRPRLIVTLGLPAVRTLLESTESLGRLRGRFHDYRGIPLLATYHPAYILRSYTVENRKKAWDDIKMVRDFLAGQKK